MRLQVKSFKVSAGKSIVFMHEKDAKKAHISPGDRIAISHNSHEAIAVVDVVTSFFKRGEIGASKKIMGELCIEPHDTVHVEAIPIPKSNKLIQKKLAHGEFTYEELKTIIADIVSGALSDTEIAYFVSSVHHCGLSMMETGYLTRAIFETGATLSWNKKVVADKHSIGGIPGNRTTPLVVAICAAAGVTMPKTSSRAITSAAGTADTIEVIAPVDLTLKQMKKVVEKTGGVLAWGGALGLAPADDKLIQVEKLLHLDPEPQLLASILSKKLAAGSSHVLIDIPYGPGAKVSRSKAVRLQKKFEAIGRHFKLKVKVVLTNGSQPIGRGVGPVLEIRDVIAVLAQENGPKDLEKKGVFLAGTIFEMVGVAKKGKGVKKAEEMLISGAAFEKFKEIIEAQGGAIDALPKAKQIHVVRAAKGGTVASIDNKAINYIARLAGAPTVKTAGVLLHVRKRSKVKKGDVMLEIHAESPVKAKQALEFCHESRPITVR